MPTLMAVLLVFLLSCLRIPASSAATPRFSPKDNILIDCGSNDLPSLPDGRVFQTDEQAHQYLKAGDDNKVSMPQANVPSALYLSARIFTQDAKYTFHLEQQGFHWVRLHFFPVSNSIFDLTKATFNVNAEKYVLLHRFNLNNATATVKEYLINATDSQFTISFVPLKNSAAFINAIEVVSVPDNLVADSGSALFPVGEFSGLTSYAFQTMFRLNMGGPLVTSANDTLGRTWVPDQPYLKNKDAASSTSVGVTAIKYPVENAAFSPLIAPLVVYASADQMNNPNVINFNITWRFNIDHSFSYLVRLHFCDIVSKALNELYFNVYLNGKMAIAPVDLTVLCDGVLATPYYKDIVVSASLVSDGLLTVDIGPSNVPGASVNAILNGVEVLKISNYVNSLDGEFGVEGEKGEEGSHRGTVAAVGFALMFGALVGLGAMAFKWHKRPQDWQKRNSFSSWLLPLNGGDTSFMSSKMGSHKSNFYTSTTGLGRLFSFAELQKATNNFDSSGIIGVGGFGNVYLGVTDEGTQVAVKRGNPQSEQGINEFQTEIQMLSKLRHRHLVSLIGYCDENEEMILVYEYMSNGPFRDHLYGKNLPTLSWKKRLEICIGAARGLHYLHTGTAQGIIHRDVKTTNILLDENFTAKVADFGLSKDGPMGENHVSTAVKGSFGYLDPEYYKRQQLTDKSDVYSFGVVLLEVLCARPAINPRLPREQVNLADWAMQWKRKDLLEKIIDPLLVGSISPESIKKFAEAAEKCLAEHGVDRPTMGDVLWNLECALHLQEAFKPETTSEDTKLPAAVPIPALPTAPIPDERPVSQPVADTPPEEVHTVNEHSGTAMFSQIGNLNGR